MSEYWSGKTVFAGFATKTDFNSIIDATVKMEKFRYNQLSKEEAETNFKKEQIAGLNRTLITYKKQIESMDTIDEFLVKKASTSKSEAVTATVKAGAEEGVHKLDVKQLASVAKVTSGKLDKIVHTGADTDMKFEYDGKEYTVKVTQNMTVKELATAINSASSGKVKASVIDLGSDGKFKLQLRGMDLGAGHNVTLSTELDTLMKGGVTTGLDSNSVPNIAYTGPEKDMKFKYDGTEYTVRVTKDMTATALATAIGAASGGKVTGASVDIGGGNFRMELRGVDASVSDGLVLSSDLEKIFKGATPDTALTRTTVPRTTALVSEASKNSKFVIDGIELQRSTNSVDDVTEGVTYNLNSIEDNIVVKVETDYDAIVKNVEKFVTLTNELRKGFDLVKNYKNKDLDKKGVNYSLKGNSQIARVEGTLKKILSTQMDGAKKDEPFLTLGALGIKTIARTDDKNLGKLEFDKNAPIMKGGTKTFMDLLKSDPTAVAGVFAADGQGASNDSSTIEFKSSMYSFGFTKAGAYNIEYEGGTLPTTGGSNAITMRINGVDEEVGYDAVKKIATVKKGNAKGLSFKITDTSAGTHTARLTIKEGKIKETVNALTGLTDAGTGTFSVMIKEYTNQIEDPVNGLTRKMENEKKRLDAFEKRLIQQYARTETQLGQYKNIQSMLEFQLKSQLAQD